MKELTNQEMLEVNGGISWREFREAAGLANEVSNAVHEAYNHLAETSHAEAVRQTERTENEIDNRHYHGN